MAEKPNVVTTEQLENALSGVKQRYPIATPEQISDIIKDVFGDDTTPPAEGVFEKLETRVTNKIIAEEARATGVENVLNDRLTDLEVRFGTGFEHYCYIYDLDEDDPEEAISYPEGCDNYNFNPARMNYTTSQFEYNQWEDAFFLKYLKIAMLNFDLSVRYEIQRNDFNKKLDGSAIGEEGNVMSGIPTCWLKFEPIVGTHKLKVHLANGKLDKDYECYAHHGIDGTVKDYVWSGVYDGWKDTSGRMRSLPGKTPTVSLTAQQEMEAIQANAPANTPKERYCSDTAADYILYKVIGYMMGKTTDSQKAFGQGNVSTSAAINTGTMATKGLFWGAQDGSSGMKFLGRENIIGNIWRRCAGWCLQKGKEVIKMTFGTEDGSSVVGYNFTGDGYIPTGNQFTGNATSSYATGYVQKQIFNKYGIWPDANTYNTGSETTGTCDAIWFDATDTYRTNGSRYALLWCHWDNGLRGGLSCVSLNEAPSHVHASFGCSPRAI